MSALIKKSQSKPMIKSLVMKALHVLGISSLRGEQCATLNHNDVKKNILKATNLL